MRVGGIWVVWSRFLLLLAGRLTRRAARIIECGCFGPRAHHCFNIHERLFMSTKDAVQGHALGRAAVAVAVVEMAGVGGGGKGRGEGKVGRKCGCGGGSGGTTNQAK